MKDLFLLLRNCNPEWPGRSAPAAEIPPEELRKCNKCGVEKAASEFHITGKRSDGGLYRRPTCRTCLRPIRVQQSRNWASLRKAPPRCEEVA